MNDDIDTMPMPLQGGGPPEAAPAHLQSRPQAQPQPAPQRLALRFVGSGSEYFRIWIVNLLLTVLSLGLYYPYARARRLRYFYGATELDGHPLAFLGQARAMWRGYLLVVLLFLAYAGAGQVSATAGGVALLVLAALWPALWHASLRFRLANTGWRGLRAGFTGSRAGAYAALGPLVLMALVFLGAGVVTPTGPQQEDAGWTAWLGPAYLGVMLLCVALLPWAVLRLKRYQHGHCTFAGEQTQLQLPVRALYRVYGAMALLLVAVAVAAVLVVLSLSGLGPGRSAGGPLSESASLALAMLPLGLVLVLVYVLLPTFHTARLQNLVWSGTRSAHLQFHSRLRFRDLARLTLKNALLVALTLGLYLPFAAVAVARLRLQAVELDSSVSPEQWLSEGRLQRESAAGDAAGDLMGVDLGL